MAAAAVAKEAQVWSRKLTDLEAVMYRINQTEVCLVVYHLSLSSVREVTEGEVVQALTQLYRKTPNLRVGIEDRNGEPWFVEMTDEKIDFKISNEDEEDITQELHTYKYPREGPLWCARLKHAKNPSYFPPNLASFHADLQSTFPHCYHLFLGFSHAIGDGHVFIRISAALSHILDRVLGGEEIGNDQIGSFELNDAYIRKAMECTGRVFGEEKWRNQCIEMVNEGMPESPLVSHILCDPEGRPKKTVLHTQVLADDITARLLEKCRSNGVTMSSCVAAVGNLAFVELLQERGVAQESYSVSNSHLINMRRTWEKGTTENAFGCYIGTLPRIFLATPPSAEEDKFWGYAKEVHSKFYGVLRDPKFMEKSGFMLWCYATESHQYLQRDLTYNTRGDLTRRFEGTKNITVTNLLSCATIHNTDIPWDHVFGTVRGRLSHTIKYNTGLIDDATAHRYSDLVYRKLIKVANV